PQKLRYLLSHICIPSSRSELPRLPSSVITPQFRTSSIFIGVRLPGARQHTIVGGSSSITNPPPGLTLFFLLFMASTSASSTRVHFPGPISSQNPPAERLNATPSPRTHLAARPT